MASRKTRRKKEAFVIRSFTLTTPTEKTLERLRQEASDSSGWTVSGSAIMRALLRYVAEQPSGWTMSYLYPLIEKELNAGVVWGSKKKRA